MIDIVKVIWYNVNIIYLFERSEKGVFGAYYRRTG